MIDVQIKNKIAKNVDPKAIIVCGNTDYQVKFTFDEEWEGYAIRTARFIWNGQYEEVTFTGNVCDIPAIEDTTEVAIGVYSGDLHTTTPAYVTAARSILCGSAGPHPDPPTDVYNQLVDAIDEVAAAKVDKVTGKGLSTEDYTTAEKNKLAGIEAGAQVNVISTDAPSNGRQYSRKNGGWSEIISSSVAWGNIVGTMSNQSDLNTALINKQDKITPISDEEIMAL